MNIFLHKDIGQNKLTAAQILRDPVLFLAFGFGSGLTRKAPGTSGTVAAIPLYCFLAQFNSVLLYSLVTLALTVVGVWICDQAAKKLGEHDFGGIVWDEIAGYLITMWLVPFTWQMTLGGFVLFRLFDIFKPWPIKWIDQKIHGGLGIMLDDVLAAVFAGGGLLLLEKFVFQ